MGRQYLINFDSRRLPQRTAQILVIGSGIAGLFAAWTAAQTGAAVTVLTKGKLFESNTRQAQGGIAAAVGQYDAPQDHGRDTVVAGAGLCDADAVDILVAEGPARVKELIGLGVRFDRDGEGVCLTREGGHGRRRVLHASGDATGAEIVRALGEAIIGLPNVEVREDEYAVDLLVADNVCYGVVALERGCRQLRVVRSGTVVLATGGCGQLYDYTSNPGIATGDGMALAYRAGAEMMDMEFVQFHPTVLAVPDSGGFLISEAVRGEGALLRNAHGERFMSRYHELAELAPRDIVARAILKEMATTGAAVYLDITHQPDMVKERFPTISATCAEYGLDIARDLIPVAPAAHFMMGGVKVDSWGRTSVEGLYCCGEASCWGVHGANRLASNSLLDGIVLGNRIIRKAAGSVPVAAAQRPEFAGEGLKAAADVDYRRLRGELQRIMGRRAGPLRTGGGLVEARAFFDGWAWLAGYEAADPEQMEVRNMLTVGGLIVEAAILRTESRGGHFRLDYPADAERWRKHILFKWGGGGCGA